MECNENETIDIKNTVINYKIELNTNNNGF